MIVMKIMLTELILLVALVASVQALQVPPVVGSDGTGDGMVDGT